MFEGTGGVLGVQGCTLGSGAVCCVGCTLGDGAGMGGVYGGGTIGKGSAR